MLPGNTIVIEDVIREFLLDQLGVQATLSELSNHRSLIASGLIDSLAVLEVVEFLERRFDIALSPEDLTGENFDTVAAMGQLVRSRS